MLGSFQKRLGVFAFGKLDDHHTLSPPIALNAGRLNAPQGSQAVEFAISP